MSVGLGLSNNNVETVLQAVKKLYHDTNASEKERASKWLGDFQRSVFAWEAADQLLQMKGDLESTYFAAQTMRSKILYSFRELPQNSHESLRDSLLKHIEQLHTLSPIIITQLSLAVCDLALQMPAWNMPAVAFMQKYANAKDSLPYLLELLTVLPEEVNNRALRLGANRRTEIMEEMENSAPMVIELLKAYISEGTLNEKLMAKLFKCLGSWFYLGVLPGNHVARCKLLDHPFSVLRDVNASSNIHEAASDCVCSALYAAEDVARHSDLIVILFQGTHSLREAYHNAVAHEDTDKCLNLCRIFTELAESLIEPIVNHPGEALGDLMTLDLLLLCNTHFQYEVAEITFNLWYRLSDMLHESDRAKTKSIFGPYIERLIYSLVRHCQMEPDNDKILDEHSDFNDFRSRVAELVCDVVFLVGATECFAHLFSILSNAAQPPTWDVTEATLYVMGAIARLVDEKEESATTQVLQAVVSLPETSHITVRHTGVRLIGQLAQWISKHSHLLDPILQFLTGALQQRELASVSATALQQLCLSCRADMARHYHALVELIKASDQLNISRQASLGLLKGVVTVLCCLPSTTSKDCVQQLCVVQVQVLKQQLADSDPSTVKDPTTMLDRLAAIFRNMNPDDLAQNGSTHVCKEVFEEIWPVLRGALERWKNDNRIVERWCRCIRFAVRCIGKAVQTTLLAPIAETITIAYSSYQHSCFLYLGSVLVDEYGSDASLLVMLNAFAEPMFRILNEEKGLENHPDTVDDLFRLCSRFIEHNPIEFLSHSACPPLLQCALACLRHEHREANASVTKFLRSIVECRQATSCGGDNADGIVNRVVTQLGGAIVEQSLQACLFHIPTYLYPDVAELWWALRQRDRQNFSDWLKNALKNLPSEATLATATPQQTLLFHEEVTAATEWKSVSYHLRDFCRLYR